MHVEAVPQPLLRLATNLALKAITVASRHEVLSEVITQVLEDRSALCKHNWLGEGWSGDGNDRRLAQRVDFLELRRRELVRLTLVDFHGVGGGFGAFFEKPDDALGARLLEPEWDSQ